MTLRPSFAGAVARAATRFFSARRAAAAEREARLQRLAFVDSLTGLPNRTHLRDAVQSEIDQRARAALSVVVLDLDRLRHLNEVLGRRFGDRVLKTVAERITGQGVRDGDLVARLGGDTFALLLRDADGGQAQRVAARLAAAFDLPLVVDGLAIDIGAAFGIAIWPAHAAAADALLARAEAALAAARRRTGIVVYDTDLDAGGESAPTGLPDPSQSANRGEPRLFLQPRVDIAGRRLVGAEVLVRRLTPSTVEACAAAWPALHRLGLERLSIPLSARDLIDRDLPVRLGTLLARHRVRAGAFCLDVPAHALAADPRRAAAALDALAAAGFRLALDGFDGGGVSPAQLCRLPLDELKLDRRHVAGITRDGVFKRMSPNDWYSVINTNLNSVFNVTRQVIEGMVERSWGRIINVSSVNALRGQFGQTNYSAAKAGMHGFSKALAQEVVKKGVTVNTISPGYVETDMVRAIKPDVLNAIIDQIPMGRLAQPGEIAGLIAYLASEEAGYITGANISINGGLHMN